MRVSSWLALGLCATFLLCIAVPVSAQVQAVAAEDVDPFGNGQAEADPFAGDGEDTDPFASEHDEALEDTAESEPDEQPSPLFHWATPDAKINKAVYAKLQQSIGSAGYDFTDTPLAGIVDFLRAETGLEIQINQSALDDLGLSSDESITCNLRNLSIGVALKLMLRPLECSYVVEDGVLHVTTEEEALTHLKPAVHDVRELAGSSKARTVLAMVLQNTVDRGSWIPSGGEGVITHIEPGLMIVTHTAEVQHKVAALLQTLRDCQED